MATDLTWMPAWQIRELIRKREVAPTEVVKHFMGRIEEYDDGLHSFMSSRTVYVAHHHPAM
jgi:aspartyl-tRNA(Asn)/glutamyl-tRNA(Gln) amidotransferase subunit A